MNAENYKQVDPKSKTVNTISNFLFSLILFGIITIATRFTSDIVKYILYGLTSVISIMSVFIRPTLEYKRWKYSISDNRIDVIHGIYVCSHYIVPIKKIQYLNIIQGPIQKHFKLSNVEIVTAGSQIEIENLSTHEAEIIVENLNEVLSKGDYDGEN